MATPLIAKIDVKKINKDWLFTGAKGTYLDAVIYENDNVDQYGNSHVIKQGPPAEARAQGAKPIIIGNCKLMPQKGGGGGYQKQSTEKNKLPEKPMADGFDDSEIPF